MPSDVLITSNVEPYELMKLRLLNSSHSALSYTSWVKMWPPPCLTTPPPRPPWTTLRLGPLRRTPERSLSRLEAYHGLRSSPQPAP